MRYASISVGIVDYVDDAYRTSTMRLQYATADARAFSRYATLIDEPGNEGRHRLLSDRNANLNRMRTEFRDLANAGEFDIFLLYLSGHGETDDAAGGWFCLADAEHRKPSLSGRQLDELLYGVQAAFVCVLIDCCYAESIAAGMTFFSELQGASGRFLLASARVNQRSWEDDSLKRSLFSDVLLRALSTGSPVATSGGFVDVEAALFPYLREQVPLAASALKRGNVQEPVTFGASTAQLRLPTVTSVSLGRRLTTSQAIRAGVRRILIAAAVVSVALLLAIDIFLYHLAVDSTGQIMVRPGLRPSFSLQPIHPVASVETGFRVSDLDPRNGEFIRRLAGGSVWGFRTHLEADGLRPWLTSLETGLDRRIRSSTEVLAQGGQTSFHVDDDPAPVVEAKFLSRLNGSSSQETGRQLYDDRRHVDISCEISAATNIDFTLLSAKSEVFAQDMAWAAATAPHDTEERAWKLLDLAKLYSYRSFHSKDDEKRLTEFTAFATAVAVMTGAEGDRTPLQLSLAKILPQTYNTWCDLGTTFVRAIASDRETSAIAESRMWELVEAFAKESAGTEPTPSQSVSFEGLAALARRRPLTESNLEHLSVQVETDGVDLGTDTPAHVLISKLAPIQELPKRFTAFLIEKLGSHNGEFDFNPIVAARMLACNAHFLDNPSRSTIKEWLEGHAAENRTMSEFHTALGCAALEWPLDPEQLSILQSHVSPGSRFPPRSANYRGETVIFSGGEEAATALGKVAQKNVVDPVLTEELTSVAAARTDMKSREEILSGLAHQWYRTADANVIYDRLTSASGDSIRRSLEVDVAAQMLHGVSGPEKMKTINSLLKFWHGEAEPEVRIALANLLGRLD